MGHPSHFFLASYQAYTLLLSLGIPTRSVRHIATDLRLGEENDSLSALLPHPCGIFR
jgi:hypothetical protein